MNSSRRWLIIFAAAIGILVVTAVALVLFTGKDSVTLLQEDAPQGIVQRFLMAVQDKDYQKAYNYLLQGDTKTDILYKDWAMSVPSATQSSWKATLGETILRDEQATVEVSVEVFSPDGLFFTDSLRNQQITFHLTKIGDSWFITSPIYMYWFY
ncbi:MAG: hypothetical protein PHY28_03465 [Dehalococcoidales bacterium]|nr:hypothetical protein [Dehalococcoidales bacterium]